MRVIAAVIVALAATAVFAISNETSINGMQGLRLHCDTWSKLKYVSQFENQPGFDFLRHSRNPNVPTEVLVPADLLDDFKLELSENRIAYEIFIEDVSTVIDEGLEQQRKARLTDSSSDDILKSFPRYDEVFSYWPISLCKKQE